MDTRLICSCVLVSLLVLQGTARSAVYRCELADGSLVFQQSACYSGDEALDMPPLNTLGDGLRKSEQRWLKKRTAKPRRKFVQAPGTDSASEKLRVAEKCLKKEQKLNQVQAKLRRGYKPAQGEKLRRRRDDYSEYLRAFCR